MPQPFEGILDFGNNINKYVHQNSRNNVGIIESGIGQINGFPSYKIIYADGVPGGKYKFHILEILITAYEREYRLIFEAADKLEFDKYRSMVEEITETIKINEPKFDGISC